VTVDPPAHPSRLAFLGTPDVAVGPLRALVAAGFEVALVITRADKRRSRGGAPEPSPVKSAALELGVPVTTRVDDVLDVDVDLGVVVAFGQLVKPHVLAAVPMVNLHFSLLPRWRGAAPVERAILAGDRETGVCLMQLEEGLDTGPVYACVRMPIESTATADSLRAELAAAGTELLVDQLSAGLTVPTPQAGEPTYAAKLDPAELGLDWTRTAGELDRVVRVGRAWTTFRGTRLLVLGAMPHPHEASPGAGVLRGAIVGTGSGILELTEVQPEGRRPMLATAWINGARVEDGERLG
jgi:methionyl-tRNA formyltransferase